ncbi:hypothetical protein DFH09DRAFT_1153143 [Mycena vulgaris]|nr:hypothetical protein DFH09DRAFT_1187096 [Mycena vulgaris]KAJ6534067.1 hypothetical protein DFH09DRAFT_1180955 [Mycena vulgaris]KAJ6534698.1 hypothetical protein DFH09DRAFT_1180332 [Mycena vulgaris]KAJ6563739.1 hypothetical protein DFH09DRAFT_1158865 [Mycena vulgaris]KAJ6572573.1 hypothetical protein DFH09DRAFT_1153143 [Mycena vulgaris]
MLAYESPLFISVQYPCPYVPKMSLPFMLTFPFTLIAPFHPYLYLPQYPASALILVFSSLPALLASNPSYINLIVKVYACWPLALAY